MYKILIIEDEDATREKMAQIVDWASLECTVCGLAESGIRGLELFLERAPDIVLCDIVVPGIDGITLLQYFTEKNPDARIVMMTGYREFEYAQAVANCGAAKLLKKPIAHDLLVQTMREQVIQLKQQSLMESLKKQKQGKDTHDTYGMMDLLSKMIMGENIDRALIEAWQTALNDESLAFCIAVLAPDDLRSPMDAKTAKRLSDAWGFTRSIIAKYGFMASVSADGKMVVYATFPRNSMTVPDDLQEKAKHLQNSLYESLGISISAGVGPRDDRIHNISRDFALALHACEKRFFSGRRSLNLLNVGESYNGVPGVISLNSHALEQAIRDGRGLESAFDNILSESEGDEQYLKAQLVALLSMTYKHIYQEDDGNLQKALAEREYLKELLTASFAEDLRRLFLKCCNAMTVYYALKRGGDRDAVVERIIAYIEENYTRTIKLGELCQLTYFSPSYICALLKNKTGQSFVELVNRVRIEKAKPLLLGCQMKQQDIATKVGFLDVKYFSKVFKRLTGCTPAEYAAIDDLPNSEH